VNYGDNTDWQAIHEAALTNLPESADPANLTALVIGAGGTCRAALFALHTLGAAKILLYNRTLANAQAVKDNFPANFNITVIDSLVDLPGVPTIVVSTVPGESLSSVKGQGIYVEPGVFAATDGVAIDLAYKPYDTGLRRATEGRQGWKFIGGIDILLLQGYRQFELWTGKRAPKTKIREIVMPQYLAQYAPKNA